MIYLISKTYIFYDIAFFDVNITQLCLQAFTYFINDPYLSQP